MFERFTDAAREVVVRADLRALKAGSGLLGDEHLLLALLEDPLPADAVSSLTGMRPQLEQAAAGLRAPHPVPEGSKSVPFTAQAKKCLELALREALSRRDNYVGRQHLLLGVLSAGIADSDSVVARMLDQVGTSPAEMRQAVLDSLNRAAEQDAAREKQLNEELEAQRRNPAACVFCRMIAGKEEASPVYDDERVVALLDVRPINTGHVLVMPRVHLPYLADVGEDLGAHMYRVAHRIAGALRTSEIRCAAVGMLVADGDSAGQEIFHSHLHVYPRNPGDGYRINATWWLRERPELNQTAEAIREALRHDKQSEATSSSNALTSGDL